MDRFGVVGIMVQNRACVADAVQNVLTVYGDAIISRMGVPSQDKHTGIITMTMECGEEKLERLKNDLEKIEGVKASYCVLQ